MQEGKVLVVSIKPEYASKIFNGEKTIELRKCSPNVSKGDIILIYVTAPVKAFKGIGKVKDVVHDTPTVIWENYSRSTGINKKTFFDYYSNTFKAVGILLMEIQELEQEICLNDIKNFFPGFTPPQTFKYTTRSELQRLIGLNR